MVLKCVLQSEDPVQSLLEACGCITNEMACRWFQHAGHTWVVVLYLQDNCNSTRVCEVWNIMQGDLVVKTIHSYEREETRPLVTNWLNSRELPTTTCHIFYKLLVFHEELAPSKLGKLGYLLLVLSTKCLDLTLTWNKLQHVELLFVCHIYFVSITEFIAWDWTGESESFGWRWWNRHVVGNWIRRWHWLNNGSCRQGKR